MQQEWLIRRVQRGLTRKPVAPPPGEGKYLTLEEAEKIVDDTIGYLGQQDDDIEFAYITGHRKRLAHSLALIPFATTDSASCLDVGCYGYMAIWAWKHLGYSQVEGVEWRADADNDIIEREVQLYDDCVTLKTYNFDLSRSDWPIAKTFDTVLFLEVLEHVNQDPVGIMINIGKLMTADSTLVMSVPNAVSYKTLREFLTGMPPWTYWFFHPDLAHEPRHCFEYTPLVFKALLMAAGFEEDVFKTIFAYSELEAEADIIKIGESLSLQPEIFGETMIAQARKVSDEAPLRYPDVLYSGDGYYRTGYPALRPTLEASVKRFVENQESCVEREKRVLELEAEVQRLGKEGPEASKLKSENAALRARIDELLFTCESFLQKEVAHMKELESTRSRAARAEWERDEEKSRVETERRRGAEELQAVHSQLEEIRSSTSWIMTAPLRALLVRFPNASMRAGRLLRWGWWTLTLQLPAKLRERRTIRAQK